MALPRDAASKLLTREQMVVERRRLRQAERSVVFTNGCFDLLHLGPITSLSFARDQGDVLVVGVNADATVRHSKGPQRPVFPARDRALLLAALECVDYVVVFEEPTPSALIEELRPDVLVKGQDWAHCVSGRAEVEGDGGRVAIAPLLKGYSTTSVIARLRAEIGVRD